MDSLGEWEVLVTTYNLAQGNEHDKKFFRKIAWEVSPRAFKGGELWGSDVD